jgi:UDP-3-O-[3-hydroxymyristoyl] glucosamine N-acyltransferase
LRGKAIVELLGADVVELLGDPETEVSAVSPAYPGAKNSLSFITTKLATNSSTRNAKSNSSIILTAPGGHVAANQESKNFIIIVSNPRLSFAKAVNAFFKIRPMGLIDPLCKVDSSATIGNNVSLGPYSVVCARVRLGDDVVVGAGVFLGEGVEIGPGSSIGPNCVIGEAGFAYERDSGGVPVPLPHFGNVVIGRNVEIGSNTSIDRGTFGDTVIGNDVKIDNLVHIAHNCVVDEGAFIIAGAILSGGVTIGKRAWIAPNVTVMQQRTIGVDAIVGMGSVVISDVEPGQTVFGNPARALPQAK